MSIAFDLESEYDWRQHDEERLRQGFPPACLHNPSLHDWVRRDDGEDECRTCGLRRGKSTVKLNVTETANALSAVLKSASR